MTAVQIKSSDLIVGFVVTLQRVGSTASETVATAVIALYGHGVKARL